METFITINHITYDGNRILISPGDFNHNPNFFTVFSNKRVQIGDIGEFIVFSVPDPVTGVVHRGIISNFCNRFDGLFINTMDYLTSKHPLRVTRALGASASASATSSATAFRNKSKTRKSRKLRKSK